MVSGVGGQMFANIDKKALVKAFGDVGKGLYSIVKASRATNSTQDEGEIQQPTQAAATAQVVGEVWEANEAAGGTRLEKALSFTKAAADHPIYYVAILGMTGYVIYNVVTTWDESSQEDKNQKIINLAIIACVGLQAISNGVRRLCGWWKKGSLETQEERTNNQKALLFYYVLSHTLHLYSQDNDFDLLFNNLKRMDDALNEPQNDIWRGKLSPEVIKGIGVVEHMLEIASGHKPKQQEELEDNNQEDGNIELFNQQMTSLLNYLDKTLFPLMTESLKGRHPNWGKGELKILVQKKDGSIYDLGNNFVAQVEVQDM